MPGETEEEKSAATTFHCSAQKNGRLSLLTGGTLRDFSLLLGLSGGVGLGLFLVGLLVHGLR